MSKVEEKLAKSLTAESVELIAYLPYLLQDLWELGSSPTDIIYLIKKHIAMNPKIRVLDLACGKGAVGIRIAQTFGCYVKGIDIMSDFIRVANEKALQYGVQHLCEFVIEDINQSVKVEKDFDIVILGAVGSVLGKPSETLRKLSKTIQQNGYIIIDDGYAKTVDDDIYITKETWLKHIKSNGLNLVEDLIVNETEFNDVLEDQMRVLIQRVKELKEKFPLKGYLFDQYLNSQQNECDELRNDCLGVTLLLKKF